MRQLGLFKLGGFAEREYAKTASAGLAWKAAHSAGVSCLLGCLSAEGSRVLLAGLGGKA